MGVQFIAEGGGSRRIIKLQAVPQTPRKASNSRSPENVTQQLHQLDECSFHFRLLLVVLRSGNASIRPCRGERAGAVAMALDLNFG
ncbi:hypothetical protein ACFQ07_29470 [Actinomadura adrarensis]|uniref:Uncharacterized protein n=1 Tax=Actinomadura adrarensis TaxID=1819600 RepID=A0ABW3CPU3_9ACTN